MAQSPQTPRLTRRLLLAGLLASGAGAAFAGAPARSIRPGVRPLGIRMQAAGPVDAIVAGAKLSGDVGFVVADAETGEVLETRNPLLALPPASVTKTVTTIYGLEVLGSQHRFRTRLIATGPVKQGKLDGDLILAGGGDPTLDSDALGILAKRLKEAGVHEITGKALVYSGALPYQRSIDPDQPDHLGYNPSLSGLNLNYNRVFFEWKRGANGYAITMDARALKYRPRVAMSTMKVVERKSPVFTVKSTARSDQWTVARQALGKKGGRWLPVRRPDFYAAEVFHTIARSHGIILPAFKATKSRPAGTVVAEWQSKPLVTILRGMLKYSNNLTAEAVGVSASKKRGGNPITLAASGRQMAQWLSARTGERNAKFIDHSGLGDGSRISPTDMVRVLTRQGWNGPLRGLMKEIPFRDAKGKPIKGHPVQIHAKTGTLNFVSALAGYAEIRGGRRLAFAIFSADLAHRNKIKRAERERPQGARAWNRRAKSLQQQLIARWAAAFSA